MKSLTKREKIMLYALSVFIVLAAGYYFLILPAMNRNTALNEELTTLEGQNQVIAMSISRIPSLQKQITDAEASISSDVKRYYDPMVNDDVDKLLTGLVTQCGLKSESLSIGEIAEYTPVAYGEDPKMAVPAATPAPAANDGDTISETLGFQASVSAVYYNTATMSITGSMADFKKLIQAISDDPAIRLVTFSCSFDSTGADGTTIVHSSGLPASGHYSVSFEVYMFDKTTIEKQVVAK